MKQFFKQQAVALVVVLAGVTVIMFLHSLPWVDPWLLPCVFIGYIAHRVGNHFYPQR